MAPSKSEGMCALLAVKSSGVVYDDHHTNLVADHSAGQLGWFVSSGAHP